MSLDPIYLLPLEQHILDLDPQGDVTLIRRIKRLQTAANVAQLHVSSRPFCMAIYLYLLKKKPVHNFFFTLFPFLLIVQVFSIVNPEVER